MKKCDKGEGTTEKRGQQRRGDDRGEGMTKERGQQRRGKDN